MFKFSKKKRTPLEEAYYALCEYCMCIARFPFKVIRKSLRYLKKDGVVLRVVPNYAEILSKKEQAYYILYQCRNSNDMSKAVNAIFRAKALLDDEIEEKEHWVH